MENDDFFGIGQAEIEKFAADIAREVMGEDLSLRKEKRKNGYGNMLIKLHHGIKPH